MAEASKIIDIAGVLDRSWSVLREELPAFVSVGLVGWFGAVVFAGVLVLANAILPGLLVVPFQVVMAAVWCAAGGAFFVGLLHMARMALRGERPAFTEVLYGFGAPLLPAFLATAIIGFTSAIASFFCIIPALLVWALYVPTYMFILDGERDFWAAMEKSRALTMENYVSWLILTAVVVALKLAGLVVCTIGLALTLPMLAFVVVLAFEAETETTAPDVE